MPETSGPAFPIYGPGDIADRTGLTVRLVQYWTNNGVIDPIGEQHRGKGRHRRYTAEEFVIAAGMAKIAVLGITTQELADIAAAFRQMYSWKAWAPAQRREPLNRRAQEHTRRASEKYYKRFNREMPEYFDENRYDDDDPYYMKSKTWPEYSAYETSRSRSRSINNWHCFYSAVEGDDNVYVTLVRSNITPWAILLIEKRRYVDRYGNTWLPEPEGSVWNIHFTLNLSRAIKGVKEDR